MEGILAEKAAVVTGASSGIGRSIALCFAREGANVVIADVREEPKAGSDPTHVAVRERYDVAAEFVKCDVTRVDELQAAVSAADSFGGIDVMVNNAGVYVQENFLETTEEEYETVMDVNAKGVYFGAQRAIERMLETGGGSVINVSSVSGMVGNGDHPTYSMSKAAVRLLTYSLAHGYGPDGVRVNAIHPGRIGTEIVSYDTSESEDDRERDLLEQIPLDRSGRPDEIGDVAVFLASDYAAYVNGESIRVDGGMLSHN